MPVRDAVPEVLIVGAGPTGLTLANALTYYGVHCTVADRKAGPNRDSKALIVNVASQYGLEWIGLDGQLGCRAGRIRQASVRWEGRRLFCIDLHRLGAGSALIAQPQADTERDLIAALARQGQAVRWNTSVTAVAQRSERVRVTLAGRTSDFAYVVGCDGKHSVVRQHMDVNFKGHDHPMHFVLGDMALDWDEPQDQAQYHVFEDRFFIFVPLGHHRWRVVVKQSGPLPLNDPVKPDDLLGPLRERFGADLCRGTPSWLSRAACYSRTSDKLREGRLLLAGDAAHLFTPLGGTGMNTGMQDALSLAWRLSLRLRGQASDAILDAYQSERLEAIEANALSTDHVTRLIARFERDPKQLAGLMPAMRNRPVLRKVLPSRLAGLDFRTAGTLDGAAPLPGSAPVGSVWREPGSLAAWTRGTERAPRLTVLARADQAGAPAALLQLQAHLSTYGAFLQLIVLAPAPGCTELRRQLGSATILGPENSCHREAGLAPGALLLIDPEGVVGFSGALDQHEALCRCLQRRLGPSGPTFKVPTELAANAGALNLLD
jgi:2-polyprenyl-6-methoxyphenol hydroxylase-like FAD-dependent oxidoreductase